MQLRISLFHKGLILVAIPLIFELISYGVLADLYNRAQEEARQAEKARQISDTINLIVRNFYDMLTTIKAAALVRDPSLQTRKEAMVEKTFDEMRKVKELVEDDPHALALIVQAQQSAREANKILDSIRDAYQRGDMEECLRLQKSLNVKLKQIISPELISLAKQHHAIGDRSPERQAYYRQLISQQLLIAIALSVIMTVVLAVIVSKGITKRLAVLSENSMRLARDEQLLPTLSGHDEIAHVDQIFHTMADALAEATRIERALIENASDVICSIDKYGKFAALNPATTKVFGFSPDELLGKHYIELIPEEDRDDVKNHMESLLKSHEQEAFETKLRRKDGATIDILFSAYWSGEEKTYFCVLHDITERKDAERVKQEVMAMVSHDLRTPLTAIRHLHEMLVAGTAGQLPEQAQKLLLRADGASKRMLTLINDLLEVEKIRAGKMQLSKVEIPVANLFESCLQIVTPLAEEKSIKLNAVETFVDVFADPDRMVQVLVNISTNAIKYSPNGGTITLSADLMDQAVEIRIQDEGRGVPEEMREAIFNRFQQVHESDSTLMSGTGLGLAICKAIVELHGGSIRVECDDNAPGSTFAFTVPLHERALALRADEENSQLD